MPAAIRMSLALVVYALAVPLFFTSPALACSVEITDHSEAAMQQRAKSNVDKATAIIDGEVVRAMTDSQPALVRVHHLLRGPHAETIEVSAPHSCHISLDKLGERMRMLLVGGPDVYFLPVDQALAVYEDHLLKSDRSLVWPYRSGDAASR